MQTVNEYRKLTVSQDSSGLRTFDDINVQRAVDRALAKLGTDKHFAAVAHADLSNGKGGASLTAVCRLPDGRWSIAVGVYKPYTKTIQDLGFGAEIAFSS